MACRLPLAWRGGCRRGSFLSSFEGRAFLETEHWPPRGSSVCGGIGVRAARPPAMAFTFAAFCYMLSLVLCAALIFFAIWHVSNRPWLLTLFLSPQMRPCSPPSPISLKCHLTVSPLRVWEDWQASHDAHSGCRSLSRGGSSSWHPQARGAGRALDALATGWRRRDLWFPGRGTLARA